ncbi:MAG: cobalt ECF transporter T component CbiQ [Kiritimatiellaeota bacterium]|nr:cobalt ECF transporter T component CbiQ [Kiritimatiellota bacterium]
MHHDFIDRYSRLNSPVHRLPTGLKLITALAFLLATILLPAPWIGGFALIAFILLGLAAVSRIPPGFLASRLLMLEPFVLGIAILSLFQPGGGKIFFLLLVRSTLCLFSVLLLSNTTSFADILRVLKRCRIPGLLVTTLALLYRYLFVLIDELERMQRARAARTFRSSRWKTWQVLAAIAGQLFVRSTERAERIYAAMCARGWKA